MLIAGELNLEVPQILYTDVVDFFHQTEEEHKKYNTLYKDEEIYKKINSRPHPWQRRLLEFKGIPLYNYRNKKLFSGLIPVIDQLPIVPTTRMVLLLFQNPQPPYDFGWHFDGDKQYGFRICIGVDTDKPFLEFIKIKEDYRYASTERAVVIDSNMLEGNIYQIFPSKPNTVICINGEHYPHRVPIAGKLSTTRVVVIVKGKLTTTEFDLSQRITNELYT